MFRYKYWVLPLMFSFAFVFYPLTEPVYASEGVNTEQISYQSNLLDFDSHILDFSIDEYPTLYAHGGGLNKCGCHFNRKTGECHCHRDYGKCGCECEPRSCK